MAFIDPAGNVSVAPLLVGGYTPPSAPAPAPMAQSSMTLPNGDPGAPGPTTLPNGNPNAAPQVSNLVSYTGGPLTPQQATQLAMQAGFTGSSLVDIVAIMGRESGYDPTAQNPTTGALGLTQINWSTWPNLVPLMQGLGYNVQNTQQAVSMLTDPTVNLRIAYAVSNGGTDFSDWNLTTPGTYLDATDVPTAQAVVQQVTGQTYQPTTQGTMGNSMADAAQQGSVQFAGGYGRGIQLEQTGAGSGSGNSNLGTSAQQAAAAADLAGVSVGSAITSDGQYDPAAGANAVSGTIAAIQKAIADDPALAGYLGSALPQLVSAQQSLLSIANNVYTDPTTGQVIPFSSLPASQQAAIKSANATAYNTIVNGITQQNWTNVLGAQNAGNTALTSQFQNQISAFGEQVAAGNLTLQQANDALQRWMDANTTAQNLTQDIQSAQNQAEQWGTSNGQTAFTAADIGAAGTRLAQQAGINPNATLLQFPGVQTMNPVGNYMQTLGALGQALNPPAIPNVAGTLGPVPNAPILNSTYNPPPLTQPPAWQGAGTTTAAAPPLANAGNPSHIAGFANP